MKKVAILFSLVLGWAQTGFTADATSVGDAAAGEAQTAVCAACHGADGNSAVPTFPKLAGQGEKYLYKQLVDIRDGARPVPTMAGQLDGKTDQDLANIAAYYAAETSSGGQTDPELLALGEAVYRGRHTGAESSRLLCVPLSHWQWQCPGWLSRTCRPARRLYCGPADGLPQGLRG